MIPTRGDVDLTPILDSLPCGEVVVWDNSHREDLGIYGRYAAIEEARNEIIFTQDDDVLVDCFRQLADAYQPGVLVCNYPEPWDIPWVARGAVFDRDLPRRAFDVYLTRFPQDRFFTHAACDGIFSLLTPTVVIDHGSVDLDHGFDNGRVSTSPGWYDEKRPLIMERCACLNTNR